MTCDICEENFTRSELKKHKSKVHGIACNEEQSVAELPFKCPFCLKGFKTKLGLQRHSEIKHNTEIEVEIESDIEIENQTQEVENTIFQIV